VVVDFIFQDEFTMMV